LFCFYNSRQVSNIAYVGLLASHPSLKNKSTFPQKIETITFCHTTVLCEDDDDINTKARTTTTSFAQTISFVVPPTRSTLLRTEPTHNFGNPFRNKTPFAVVEDVTGVEDLPAQLKEEQPWKQHRAVLPRAVFPVPETRPFLPDSQRL
jgi:hypothetical protein